jgi:hypothetical protein
MISPKEATDRCSVPVYISPWPRTKASRGCWGWILDFVVSVAIEARSEWGKESPTPWTHTTVTVRERENLRRGVGWREGLLSQRQLNMCGRESECPTRGPHRSVCPRLGCAGEGPRQRFTGPRDRIPAQPSLSTFSFFFFFFLFWIWIQISSKFKSNAQMELQHNVQ